MRNAIQQVRSEKIRSALSNKKKNKKPKKKEKEKEKKSWQTNFFHERSPFARQWESIGWAILEIRAPEYSSLIGQ